MTALALREKLIEELDKIPQDRLSEVYDFVHYFGLGLRAEDRTPEEIMQFSGVWAGLPEDDFSTFLSDTAVRRRLAFSSRRADDEVPR